VSARLALPVTLAAALALSVAVACGPKQGTIGAVLAQQSDGTLYVREVPDGLAADKAGLRPDDQILLIEGMDVRMMDQKQVHQALVGEIGSTVKLTVIRGEEVIHMTVKRTPARRLKRAKQPEQGG